VSSDLISLTTAPVSHPAFLMFPAVWKTVNLLSVTDISRGLDVNMFEQKGGKPVHGRKVMGERYFSIE